jgi:hypothetical protein
MQNLWIKRKKGGEKKLPYAQKKLSTKKIRRHVYNNTAFVDYFLNIHLIYTRLLRWKIKAWNFCEWCG